MNSEIEEKLRMMKEKKKQEAERAKQNQQQQHSAPHREVPPEQPITGTPKEPQTMTQKQQVPVEPNRPPVNSEPPKSTTSTMNKKRDLGSGYVESDDYLTREATYGYGIGINGIGRMLNFVENIVEDGKNYPVYELRKDNAKGERFSKSDKRYEYDVSTTTKTSIAKPLIDTAIDTWCDRYGLSEVRSSIKYTDFVTFLLYQQLENDNAKKVLGDVLGESSRYKSFKLLLNTYNRHVLENGTETIQTPVQEDIASLSSKVDMLVSQLNGVKQQTKLVKEEVASTKNATQSLQRIEAFNLLSRWGLLNAPLPQSLEQGLGYLNNDKTLKMTNEIVQIGKEEGKRMATYKETARRNNL